ncbi:MAG: UDP-N-acetylmuramate--L-alanine ligase [Candidatus Dormibacteria bacterium]
MRVHLVGIGGAAMSALAHLYLERGDAVSGSDATSSPVTAALIVDGARVALGHDAANLGDAEVLVTSTAIKEDNPELVAARARRLRVIHRAVAAAELSAGRRVVAVAGTHGKTTTTTMTAAALNHLDPLVLSGGRLPGTLYNSRPGRGKVAVVEADESDGSFLELTPEVGVVTNIEADHLDQYRDLEEIHGAFERFAARVSSTLVACVDDDGARRLLQVAPSDVISYGFDHADVQGDEYRADGEGCSFRVWSAWGNEEVRLPAPGRHNARNAMAAIAAGVALGQPLRVMLTALVAVRLPGRRMELVAEVNGARVYDDYGHHPTEVLATLAAARETCTGRLLCAFQPHRFSRLKAMMDGFAMAFAEADEVILLPVYAAGEEPIPGADSAALAARIRALDDRPVTVLNSVEALPAELRGRLAVGDVAVCMGAGDIYQATRTLAADAVSQPSTGLGQ